MWFCYSVLSPTDGNDQQSADTGIRFPDFPRKSAIRRIALAQLGGLVDEPNANLHKVILHFRAAVLYHAYAPSEVQEDFLARSVENLKTKHLHASLTALSRVGCLTPPSVLLLQALVTGVSGINSYLTGSRSYTDPSTGYYYGNSWGCARLLHADCLSLSHCGRYWISSCQRYSREDRRG